MSRPDIGDSRKSGEPSDDDIVNTWIFRPDLHGGDLMPQLIDFARTLLARFGTRPAAEPSQSSSAGEAVTDILADVRNYGYAIKDGNEDLSLRWIKQVETKIAALSRQAPAAPVEAKWAQQPWGYAVFNPKEPQWPMEVVRYKSQADSRAVALYESKIVPLGPIADAAPTPAEPLGYVNLRSVQGLGPEDTAAIAKTPSQWRNTPIYAAPTPAEPAKTEAANFCGNCGAAMHRLHMCHVMRDGYFKELARKELSVATLPAAWDAEAERFAALGDPISLAEAGCMRNLAKDLRVALSTPPTPEAEPAKTGLISALSEACYHLELWTKQYPSVASLERLDRLKAILSAATPTQPSDKAPAAHAHEWKYLGKLGDFVCSCGAVKGDLIPEAEPVQQDTVTLRERIAELASQHGSMRAAARVMECNAGYLSRLCSGEKVDPGPTLLRRMGLREIVRYERIVTPPAEKQAAPSGEDKTS